MMQLFIIRGLPGSGKSTLARQIAHDVFEADMHFTRSGEYQFDKTQLQSAHEWCQRAVEDAMQAGITAIAVSNTFVRRWEMEPYYELARKYDYQATEVTMSGKLHHSVHGVPDETIERMRASWER